MPVKLSLELMAVIRSNFADPERKLGNDVVNEVYGVGLGVLFIDFQGSHTRGVINGRELKAANLLTSFAFESQELDVHLDMMTRNLFLISFGMNLPRAGSARKTVQPIAS